MVYSESLVYLKIYRNWFSERCWLFIGKHQLLSSPEKFIKEYIIWGMKTGKRFIQRKQSKNPKFLSGFELGTLEYWTLTLANSPQGGLSFDSFPTKKTLLGTSSLTSGKNSREWGGIFPKKGSYFIIVSFDVRDKSTR